MSFRFQRRIKLLPGLYLNASRSGLSTSARIGGVTINSRGGVSARTGITGLSYRTTLNTDGTRSLQCTDSEAATPAAPSSPGTKRIATGITLCLLGGVVPLVALFAIPCFVSGYEARYRKEQTR